MKLLYSFILFFLCSNILLAQHTFPVNGVHDERIKTIAFIHATIHIDDHKIIHDATLLIKDDKILNVGLSIIIPREAIVKDLNGKHIYPSFIELFSEYGIKKFEKGKSTKNGIQQFTSDKDGPYSWNEALRSEFNAVEEFNNNEQQAKKLREIGFGTVLTHRKDGISRGTATLVSLGKGKIHNLFFKKKAAHIMSFSKGSSSQNYPSSWMGSIALLRQTYLDGVWYRNNNEKEVNLTLEAWNNVQALPQIFQGYDVLDILRADKIAKEFSTKFIIKGVGDEYQRLYEIKKTNTSLIVPVNFPKAFEVTDPYDALLVSLEDLKHWELAPFNLKLLSDNKIEFSITSNGLKKKKEFLKNIKLAVKNGLPKEIALASLTTIPAKIIKVEKYLGKLKKGFISNFIITSGDIFESDSKILENWIQGQYFEIEKESPVIFGDYKLVIESDTFDIVVESLNKMKMVINDSTSVKIKNNVLGNSLTLSFVPFGKTKKVRLNGNIELGYWTGEGQDENGNWMKWQANLINKKSIDKNESTFSKPEIPKIIFPFNGFGLEVIPSENNYLIKNATVWTNESDGVLENYDVLIRNGKISKIDKSIPDDKNIESIDATGKFLTCGIIDEHSHIAVDRGINECSQAVTSEVRIGDVLNSEDINIYRQLAGGVTTSQILHGSCNPIGGQSALIKLKWGEAPEKLKFPNAPKFIKFALGENVKKSRVSRNNRFPDTRMGVEQVFRDAFTRAKEYRQKKNLKLLSFRKDLELEALVEILEGKRNITCHSYVQSEINMLIHVADEMGFKVNTFTHVLEGYKISDKLKDHGAGASTFSDWWAYKYEVIDAIPYNTAMLTNQGIITAINSDDPEMARRLNQEAAKTMKYGNLTEQEAWKLVTLNPAILLHISDKVGSIKLNKQADLVLWSDNPLSIQAKVEMTFIDGIKYFDRKENEIRKVNLDHEKNRLIQKMLSAKANGAKTKPVQIKVPKIYHCDTVD